MKRALSGIVTLIGVLFLIAGGFGTAVSLVVLVGDKSHHLATHVVQLLWALSGLLLAWGLLSSRFLLYGLATLALVAETIAAWTRGDTGPAIYATVLTAFLLAYAWQWLGELAKEDTERSAEQPVG